ncbi:zinc finger protein hangover isoform X2 [Ooceraea biroi]|uniref:zinc finger protein hangover isoform X2 n=1 Tax=Ooceraea biroi TaxID=2015173 RepID=UPI000F074E1D|nr:zinc finger protein hangover isoform X2 [Ooceraea biroi]
MATISTITVTTVTTTTTTETSATTVQETNAASSSLPSTATTMESKERYDELCRLCASYNAIRMNIFGQEGKNRQLVDKIQILLPFKILEDDCLPKVLCYRCMFNLENFYDFRTACVHAAAWLKRNSPREGADDDGANDSAHCKDMHLKGKENMPVLIPEAPVVNPNAALGTPPRLNFDGEADPEIEEIVDTSEGTDEVADDAEDRRSEYEYYMDTIPSDFLEQTPMVTEETEECGANNTVAAQDTSVIYPHTSQQHELYVCSRCNKAFSSKGHLSLHARIHAGEGDVIGERVITDDHTSYQRPYQCDLCHKSYSTAKHRWGHVSSAHKGHPAVTCAYCSRIYSTRYNLNEHIKSRHAGLPPPPELPVSFSRAETRYQCQTCPMVYTDLAEFNAHRQLCFEEQRTDLLAQAEAQNNKGLDDTSDISSIDSDDENRDFKNAEAKLAKNPQLTILKQALTKGDGLKRNYDDDGSLYGKSRKIIKTESGDTSSQKRWYCETCPQSFTSVDSLKEHEIKHDAEKPFICILCKKDFVLKSSLSRHIITLHGVDPTPIIDSDKCLKATVLSQNWNDRMDVSVYEQSEMKEPPEFSSSPEATLEIDEKDSKNNHDNMIEIETVFVCEICTRDFSDRASLWLHIRATHKELAAFACGVCLKICSDNEQLQNHVNMYHGGSKLLISEQRRYSCTICGRQHDSRKKLIAHVSIHNIDSGFDPANFVQLNSNYYNENLNGNEGNEQIIDFDGEDGEKVDCYICYKSFPNEDHLIRHQRNAHKSEQIVSLGDGAGGASALSVNGNKTQYNFFFVCEVCGNSFSSKWERWLHINNMHSNEASIKCEWEDCGKIFATKSLRNEHAQHHLMQGSSPNTCEVCGKLWPTRVDYWKHVMGVHSDTVPLICGVCLKVFSDVLQLSAHVKTKHWPLTNGDFSCDICGRPYSNKSKMSRHRKIHGLEAAIDAACDNSSINETTNESSKPDNNGAAEMELNCEQCPELRFSTLDSLCNHRRIVHGLFPCDLCNKCYGRTSHLWKHVNRVHKGHVDVTCPYCLKTSASRDHLAAHIAKIHRYEPAVSKDNQNYVASKSLTMEDGVLHYCEKCNKGFHKRYLLRRHMKGCQNYRKDPGALLTRCRACERIFKDRASLQKHIENHHSTYTCHLCNETITSKLGIMTHNRVNHMDHPDLTCDHLGCKKLFRTKEDLEAHRKDHKYHSNPNVCDFCGDTVENKLKLKMHVLSLHRNEIGVSCGVCLIPMKDPKDLKKHVEAEHGSVLSKANTCQVCGKQYASKWKAFDHTKKCHGKVFLTCKQCLAVFTDENSIRDHYEHVHNVPKDQLAAFEYRMEVGVKREGYETPDIIVKEEPDDLEFDEEICDESSNDDNSRKRKQSSNDTYDCEMCPEVFLNLDTLARHYQNMHNTDPVRMFKKFRKDGGDGKRKMRNRNNFECKNCKKQFSTKALFWNHTNVCTRRGILGRSDMMNNVPTSILESHLTNNNQMSREEPMPLPNESNLNIPDFNLFEGINLQLSGQKPVPNLMPLSQVKPTGNGKCSRKDSRKVYDESTNTECTCEVCGKQWPAKKHLWQHLIRFHRAEAAVTCGVCLKLCKSYQDLTNHLRAQHAPALSSEGNNFTCKTCGRYHNARSKLLLHMSIHIGNFRCKNCQQGFANEKKLAEHATSCSSKSELEDHAVADEDNAKNDNDEKGSLIADETSVIGEAEEADFESEGDGSRDIPDEDSNSDDNSQNSEDSDSGSNSSSSDDEEEEEEEEEEEAEAEAEEKQEGEEEEEEENASSDAKTGLDTRSTSRASGISCNSDESDSDEAKVIEHVMPKKIEPQMSNLNRFRIRNEGLQETSSMEKSAEAQRINTAMATVAEQAKPSNMNNVSVPGSSASVDKLEALHLEESMKAATNDVDLSENESENEENNENDEEEEEEEQEEGEEEEEDEDEDEDEGEGESESEPEAEVEAEGEADAEVEAAAESAAEDEDEEENENENESEDENEEESEAEAEEDEEEEKEDVENDEEEQQDDDDDDDDGPPVLSPIMPLLPENESEEHSNTADRTRHKLSPMVLLSVVKEECDITEIQNDGASSHAASFFAANNNDLPVTWDEELNDNGEHCDSDDDREKNEEYGKEYEKVDVNEGEDFEENSADESGRDVGDNQVHEIHNLDGTVLMVANDAEGNQILIEQNVLDIDNDDSNAEGTQYIYPETAYEIEEDYAARNETDAIQTDEIQGISYVQDTSENEDSMEEKYSIEENSSDVQK